MNLSALNISYKRKLFLSFCAWLISLGVMSLKFMLVVAYVQVVFFFFFLSNTPWYEYTLFSFTNSFFSGCLDCFYLLAILNNAAVK